MRVWVRAEGPPACGKTFILQKLTNVLGLYGFEVFKQGHTQPGELVILDREDDKANFVVGDKLIPLGDWVVELDINNELVAAYHEGKDVYAREVEVNFSVGQITTVKTMNVVKRDEGVRDIPEEPDE